MRSRKNRRLIIDLLCLERGKAYGFQEYSLNLLNYFYHHREELFFDEIDIWCKCSEKELLNPFADKFKIMGFSYESYLKRFWLQTILPFRCNLSYDDLLFSPGNVSGLIKRSKIILTIHDLLFKRKDWLPSKLTRYHREILVPISVNNADKIVAISNFTKEDVERFYPKSLGKLEVIYNSFNFSKFESVDSSDINDGYFIAISSNYDYKNQSTIFKAFRKYLEKGGDKRLVVVGYLNPISEAGKVLGTLPDDIRNKVVIKEHITNKELGVLYRGASCFISASKFEGLGMPVVEAMSFGLPVLLSDIPPHREVSMGKGEYFKKDDYEMLCAKMLSMSFERKNYSMEIQSLFSEENTAARYVELFNRLGQI